MIIFEFFKKTLLDVFRILLKLILIFFLILFLIYVFPDLFKSKSLRTFLGAKIFILLKDMTPHEARILIVEEARHNFELKSIPHDTWWKNMHVIGNEYFFSVIPPKGHLTEWGYYINPDTEEIRYVNTDHYFSFPTLIDFSVIPVDEKGY